MKPPISAICSKSMGGCEPYAVPKAQKAFALSAASRPYANPNGILCANARRPSEPRKKQCARPGRSAMSKRGATSAHRSWRG